jgi:hypothetical protein
MPHFLELKPGGFPTVLLENSVPNPYVPPGPVPPQPTTEQELLFEHENRIRALEGQRPISVGDFINKTRPPT